MKKIIFILITIILFLLDWAALHDIIKGNEPDYTGEYFILAVSVLFYAYLAYFLVKKKINAASS